MNLRESEEAVVVEPRGKADAAVIWLHGLGADGHDFVPIVPELALPADWNVRFVFPHAPVRPVTINGGMRMRAWYDITPDMRRELNAHGQPEFLPKPYQIEELGRRLRTVLGSQPNSSHAA